MSESSALKFSTYALTIRPRDGIDDGQIAVVTAFIKKRSDYYHIITEKTGHERHLHAACFFKMSVTKSNLATLLVRLAKNTLRLTEEEIPVLRKGIKILYNNDFIEKYMDKNDDTVVIASELPPAGHMESFFPPKPAPPETRKKEKHSAYYWNLEELWYKHVTPTTEVNTINARHFLFNMMYNLRLIPVIRDDKQIVQTARHLTRWIKKTDTDTIQMAPFEYEE